MKENCLLKKGLLICLHGMLCIVYNIGRGGDLYIQKQHAKNNDDSVC